MDSKKIMSEYNFVTKYAQTKQDGTKESWNESVDRIWEMHKVKYNNLPPKKYSKLLEYINEAKSAEKDKLFLSAQRARQFASIKENEGILKHELKMYNCLSTYVDRPKVFSEIMYSLLCGSGVGFSVQKQDINKLPTLSIPLEDSELYIIEDSIEGWADAIGKLMDSYFYANNKTVRFDYSQIRQSGSLIAGQFIAPGPEGLKNSIENIRNILIRSTKVNKHEFKLKTIDAYDIVMWIADAVLSGGVRRSATICLFSPDDEDMLHAKTGDWYINNGQRRLSNNSVILNRNNVEEEEFKHIIESVKEFGEPGFLFVSDNQVLANPCVEIGLVPLNIRNGESGFQGCNLVEVNGALCNTKENLLKSVRAATIAASLQAGYTNFKYLDSNSKEIFEKEALLGVSITGWMNNPKILFNEEIMKEAAELTLAVNEEVANLIGINKAARLTTVKPSGNSSILLESTSGIHGDHSKRYIRNLQVNKTEIGGNVVKESNPIAVEQSAYSETDNVISFPIKSDSKSVMKSDLVGVKQLEYVKRAQQSWVLNGMRPELCTIKGVTHNVSNTIQVGEDDWESVSDYIWKNRDILSGVSLLPLTGELSYAQAPFQMVNTSSDIINKYGVGAMFSSGLIVGTEGLFKNLWDATDHVEYNIDLKTSAKDDLGVKIEKNRKQDWIRRFKKFSRNYFNNDYVKTIECLKEVYLLHRWNKLDKTMKRVDWSSVDFTGQHIKTADNAATACAGGACEI